MIFLNLERVHRLHTLALINHGGLPGILDEGALESALIAPENLAYYDESADLADCAAAYAFHLTMAHAFCDGNKRVGAMAARAFLLINDVDYQATEDEKFDLFIGIAEGRLSREEVASFIRSRLYELPPENCL